MKKRTLIIAISLSMVAISAAGLWYYKYNKSLSAENSSPGTGEKTNDNESATGGKTNDNALESEINKAEAEKI